MPCIMPDENNINPEIRASNNYTQLREILFSRSGHPYTRELQYRPSHSFCCSIACSNSFEDSLQYTQDNIMGTRPSRMLP